MQQIELESIEQNSFFVGHPIAEMGSWSMSTHEGQAKEIIPGSKIQPIGFDSLNQG